MANIVGVEAEPQANTRQLGLRMNIDSYDLDDSAWLTEKTFVECRNTRPFDQGKAKVLWGTFPHIIPAISKHHLGYIVPASFNHLIMTYREPILIMVGGERQEIVDTLQEHHLKPLQQLLILSAMDCLVRQATIQGLWNLVQKTINANKYQAISATIRQFLRSVNRTMRQRLLQRVGNLDVRYMTITTTHTIFLPLLSDSDEHVRQTAIDKFRCLDISETTLEERQFLRATYLLLLNAEDWQIRQVAIKKLRNLAKNKGGRPWQSNRKVIEASERQLLITILYPFLSDTNEEVRRAAIEGFQEVAEAAIFLRERQYLYTIFQRFLNDPDHSIRCTATKGLSNLQRFVRLYKKSKKAGERQYIQKTLISFLNNPNKNVRKAAAYGFTALAEKVTGADERIIIREIMQQLLRDEDVRDVAVNGLKFLAAKAIEVDERQHIREALEPFLRVDKHIRYIALEGFAALAANATTLAERQTIPAIIFSLLSVSDEYISEALKRWAMVLCETSTDVLERYYILKALTPFLSSRNQWARKVAVQGLVTVAKKATEYPRFSILRTHLMPIFNDVDRDVQQDAIEGLEAFDENATNHKMICKLLMPLLESGHNSVLGASVKVLMGFAKWAIEPGLQRFIRENLKRLLSNGLSNGSRTVREEAAQGFVALYKNANANERQDIRKDLISFLNKSNGFIREDAAKIFGMLCEELDNTGAHQIIREIFQELLGKGNEWGRRAAVQGFSALIKGSWLSSERITPNKRRIIREALTLFLNDDDYDVRQAADKALEDLDENAFKENQVIYTTILPLLEGPNRGISYLKVREFAAFAGQTTNTSVRRISCKTFMLLMNTTDKDIQYVAAQGLAALARSATEVLERQYLSTILRSLYLSGRDWRVQQAVAQGFRFLGENITPDMENDEWLTGIRPLLPIDLDNGNMVITANDFLRELNHRLRYEQFTPSMTLPKSKCRPEHLIRVISHKGNGTPRFQTVYDPDHILMYGEEFTPTDHNQSSAVKRGTRKVGFYSFGGKRTLCLKEAPEAPGLERAFKILDDTLFGHATIFENANTNVPNSETILLNGKVFTASSYVDGKPLDDDEVMQDMQTQTTIINLHQMKVLTILTAPEDGRAQNYILQYIDNTDGSRHARVVSIDNERTFGNDTPHLSSKDPRITVRGHSVIYGLSEKDPDYTDLAWFLYSDTLEAIVTKWLKQVKLEYNYHRSIKPYAKPTEVTHLNMPITIEIARSVWERLMQIRIGLREGRTLEDIFILVNPALAEIYQIPRSITAAKSLHAHSKDGPRYPKISLAEMLPKLKKIDSGRFSSKAPPSAYCEIHGDYLAEDEAIMYFMYSSEDRLQMIISGWRRELPSRCDQ